MLCRRRASCYPYLMKAKYLHTVLQILAVSVLCLMFITACSGGRDTAEKNRICAAKYDPLDVGADKNYSEKASLKPGETFQAAANEYVYEGVELYYYNVERGIRLHLREYTDNKGKLQKAIVCASGDGITAKMEPLIDSIEFVSDIKATDGQPVKIKTRHFEFDLQAREKGERWLEFSVTTPDGDYSSARPVENVFFPAQYDKAEQFFMVAKKRPKLHESLTRWSVTDRRNRDGDKQLLIVRALVQLKH